MGVWYDENGHEEGPDDWALAHDADDYNESPHIDSLGDVGDVEVLDSYYDEYDDEYEEALQFADPFGESALRATSRINPRNLPCLTCGRANRLTAEDVKHGYQCDTCADEVEGCW